MKTPSVAYKQYVVLVLTTEYASSNQTPPVSVDKLQDKKSDSFQQGYFITPKGKRGIDDEYFSSISSRKGSGVINLKLPHHGSAAGIHYDVKAMDTKEIVSICNCKIKIDQVRLLEEPNNIAYSKTIQLLQEKTDKGSRFPPAVDAVKGEFVNKA